MENSAEELQEIQAPAAATMLFRNRHPVSTETDEHKVIKDRVRQCVRGEVDDVPCDDWEYLNVEVLQHVILEANCLYCKTKLSFQNFSLDRIDNNGIHESKNIILSCGPCNIARSDNFKVEEFMATCELLRKMRKMDTEANLTLDLTSYDGEDNFKTLYDVINTNHQTEKEQISEKYLQKLFEYIQDKGKLAVINKVKSTYTYEEIDYEILDSTLDEIDLTSHIMDKIEAYDDKQIMNHFVIGLASKKEAAKKTIDSYIMQWIEPIYENYQDRFERWNSKYNIPDTDDDSWNDI